LDSVQYRPESSFLNVIRIPPQSHCVDAETTAPYVRGEGVGLACV
jgi:hypothetical protein